MWCLVAIKHDDTFPAYYMIPTEVVVELIDNMTEAIKSS